MRNKRNRMWKKWALLLVVAGVFGLTGSESGHTQGPCTIERGLDVLDVLKTSVKHNVWVLLDTSGSMASDYEGRDSMYWDDGIDDGSDRCDSEPGFTPPTRIETAVNSLNLMMDELVDTKGEPLVNWGYIHYLDNRRDEYIPGLAPPKSGNDEDVRTTDPLCPPLTGDPPTRVCAPNGYCCDNSCTTRYFCDREDYCCFDPFLIDPLADKPPSDQACLGVNWSKYQTPPACEAGDNRTQIRTAMPRLPSLDANPPDPTPWCPKSGSEDYPGNFSWGFTPNGISLDQLSAQIQKDIPVGDLFPGQKNFIIVVTDGDDTCECGADDWTEADIPIPNSQRSFVSDKPALRSRNDLPTPTKVLVDPALVPKWYSDSSVGEPSDKMDYRTYNAALKAQIAYERLNPTPADRATGDKGNIFVVFIGKSASNARDRANHLAWEASGAGHNSVNAQAALFAENQTELIQALRDTFAKIGVPTSEVSLGASVPGSVKEVIPTFTAPTCNFTEDDIFADSEADVDAFKIRNKYKTNVLFTTSVETPGFRGHFKAFNIYKATCDADGKETGRTADLTEIWPAGDAGEQLSDRDLSSDPRKILFNRYVVPGTPPPITPLTFDTTNVTAADLDVTDGFLSDFDPLGLGVTANDAVKIIVNLIHGWRLVKDPDPQKWIYNTTSRTEGDLHFTQDGKWPLFEATNSAPAIVLNPPRSPDIDPPHPSGSYRSFYFDQANRVTMAYLGTNGGMLHGFRADNGREVFAYIPSDLLPKLKNLVENLVSDNNGLTNHEFFVASSPIVEDAFLHLNTDQWRTVLTFGRGPGGKWLTALDVTDIGDFDQLVDATADPRLLFNVGNRDGEPDPDSSGLAGFNYDGLGETWSLPVMGRLNDGGDGQWAVFAGSGYGCTGTEEGKFFYVLALEDGAIIKKAAIPSPDPPGGIKDVVGPSDIGVDENALVATPGLYNPHTPGANDGKDFITRAYIGDLQGFVYKLHCSAPLDVDGRAPVGLWPFDVFFEVTSEADQSPGQGVRNQPITAGLTVMKLSGSDRVWIFLGTGGDNRVQLTEPDRFKFVGLEDQDDPAQIYPGQLIITSPGGDPFFFDLKQGERVTVPPVTALDTNYNGVVFLAASRSEFTIGDCANHFFSTLYAASATSGLGAFDLDPGTSGIQSEVDLGGGKVTGLFHRDEHLYVSRSGGIGANASTEIRGSDEFKVPPPTAGAINVLVTSFRLSPF